MRYAQGGGLTAEWRAFREQVRFEAAARFEADERTSVIAREVRVSERSVERWRRSWREGGIEALSSSGPASVPKLSEAQFAELEELLGSISITAWSSCRRADVARPTDRCTDRARPRPQTATPSGRGDAPEVGNGRDVQSQ
ncbi:helix-turn-helix domain-containing protein [Kitasatospora sp. NPDC091257]|uniref:helix-turn-helix domain-containing protein n=1 Tax=Kitasatospora sp. NPDC091257 TaxID=3364084 RepID=UPI0038213F5D